MQYRTDALFTVLQRVLLSIIADVSENDTDVFEDNNDVSETNTDVSENNMMQ